MDLRDYKTYIAGPILMAALFLTLSVLAGPGRPVLAIAALSICMGFMYCYAVYWTALTAFAAEEVLAVAMGTINAIGNLGGFFGPFLVGVVIDQTGSVYAGEAMLVVFLVIAGLFALQLRNRQMPQAAPAVTARTVAAE